MHSVDIVYKNDRIIVVEITVDMKNVIIAIIYAPQTSVEKNKKKSSNMYKCYWGPRVREGYYSSIGRLELGDEQRMWHYNWRAAQQQTIGLIRTTIKQRQ